MNDQACLTSLEGLAIAAPRAFPPEATAPAVRRTVPIIAASLALLAFVLGGCSKAPEKAGAPPPPDPRTTGSLLVKSNVADAEIDVTADTAAGGSAPTAVKGTVNKAFAGLPAGKYTVAARAAGWPEIYGSVHVSAGAAAEVAMNFKSGSLNLDSVPSGATIKHGATVLGQTPLLILQLPAGESELTLEYPSWPALTRKIAITENQESTATVRLPHGRLSVDSVPAGAQVRLDGRVLGRTPLVVEQMPAGPKRIILQADDYPQVTLSFTLQDQADMKLRPELGSVFPLLDTTDALGAVWVPDDPNALAPEFDSVGRYEPKNGVVKNINRKKIHDNWLRKKYRFAGVVKAYDPRDGEIEFVEQSNVLSKNRVVAKLSPEARAAGKLNPALVKGATLAIYGQLTAVEEPRWPSKVITFEISLAEVLQAGSSAAPAP